MPQIINTNIASLNAQRNLNKSQSANQTSLQRLSSGLRINSAKDDAAGLAISTRFNSQIRGLNVAVRNAGDGISLAQTAEGALGSMNDNLQRIRELAVQSANATNSDVDRDALQSEVSQLLAEVSRTAEETDFNGRKLLDGSFDATFQIGANAGQTLNVSIAELTADKLGSAATAGVTAIGNSNDLSNGDLIINGVSIAASNSSDDTSSTANAGASAISKVEAINRHSDDTGVTASVNTNVVSGAEMTGAATDGKLVLNGVEIDLTTTASTSGTRASVTAAINAVADQTGVTAVNTESDKGGIQLLAADGRNVSMTVIAGTGTNLSASSTGLALDTTNPITNAATYEGGFTLVADSAVGSIVIDGGNGTGKGDLSNAGIVKGTYDRGVATTVSGVISEDTTAASITTANQGSLNNNITSSNDNALVLGGATANKTATGALAASAFTSAVNFTINALGPGGITAITGAVTVVNTSIIGTVNALDAITGVDAFERIEFYVQDISANGSAQSFNIAGQTITVNSTTGGAFANIEDQMEYITEQINNIGTSVTDLTFTAELNAARSAVSIVIDNYTGTGITIGQTTAGVINAVGSTALVLHQSAAPTSVLVGSVAINATDGYSLSIAAMDGTAAATATNAVFTGKTFSGNEYSVGGSAQSLSTTGKNEINVSIDGVAQTAQTLDENSTTADLVSNINTNFADVNAWEEISLTFDSTNMEVGDTLYLGTGADVTAGAAGVNGIAVSISDLDGSGGAITVEDIMDSINGTNFSAQNFEVSANKTGTAGEFTLTIKNFSGSQIGAVVDGSGRSMTVSGGATANADDKLIGSVQKQLSGTLAYSSETGQKVDITLSNPSVAGEFFSNNSSQTSYGGVNGLNDGDLLINGVSIGGAKVEADTASAEFASDGTKILSSSKELSAIAVAASINAVSPETGVSAEINATEVVGGDGTTLAGIDLTGASITAEFAVGDSAEIYINGYTAGTVTLQADSNGDIDADRAKADALGLINSIAGRTGVEAIDNGVSLTMTAEDGRNISIAIDDQSGANKSIGAIFGMDATSDADGNGSGIGESTFGANPAATNTGVSAESTTYQTTYGTIRLESAGEFTISAGAEGADELEALGLTEGSYGGAVDGQFLTEIDISTFEGATSALTAIDNAIGAIASQRADLGAIQNRMESTVSNLAITSENLSAANSRIQDADFAAETAELSRTQVLQQAGISILSQANQGPQQVLSLLG